MKKLIIFITMIFIGVAANVRAQDFYVGASIGNTFFGADLSEIEQQAGDISENSTGYKFFGGVSFPAIFGIEGGYRNLGTLKVDQYSFETETTGWDVYGMGRLQVLGLVDLFAKAGWLFWKTDSRLVQASLGETGSDFAWGLGAGVHLGPIGVRLEYENFNIDNPQDIPITLSMLMLGATYGF